MKLFELNGIKRFANLTSDQVQEYIRTNLGTGPVQVLGNGHHGIAVAVGGNVYKFWMQDSAYAAFVRYAMQHRNNPFLPKFLSEMKTMPAFFLRSAQAPDSISYVKMERLTPIPWYFGFAMNMDAGSKDAAKWGHMSLANFLESLQHMDPEMMHETPVQEVCHCLEREYRYEYQPEYIPQNMVDLMETVRGLIDVVNETGHQFDLQTANFMMRGDQLVIIDPLYSEEDAALNAQFQEFNLAHQEGDEVQAKPGTTRRSGR